MGEDGRVERRRQLHGTDDRLDEGKGELDAADGDTVLARRGAGRIAILAFVAGG
jgi:hypothetical protein